MERPLRDDDGDIIRDRKGNAKANSELRDYENIPFLFEERDGSLRPQTIEEYFEREVLPHAGDAWIDHAKTKKGYEINFTKYFYEFKPLRALEDIMADIRALETETAGIEKVILD